MKRAVIVLVILVAACSSGGGSKAATDSSPSSSSNALKIGDTAKIEGGTVTVHSFANGVADVEQCGGSPNPLSFRLALADNRTASVALGKTEGQLTSGKVASGDCVRGNVAFDIPAGAQVAAVVWTGFGETAISFKV